MQNLVATMELNEALRIDPTILTQMTMNSQETTLAFQEMFKNTYYWHEIASETLPRFKLLVEQTFLKYKDYYEKALEIYNSDVDWKAGWLTAINEITSSSDKRNETNTYNGTQNGNNNQTNIDLPNYSGTGTPSSKVETEVSNSISSTKNYNTDNITGRNFEHNKSSVNVLDERSKALSQVRNILLEFVEKFKFCFVLIYN